MQRHLWAFPLIVLLAAPLIAAPAAIADDDWDEDNAKGTTALEDGKYQVAEKAFLAAKKDCEKSGSKYGHYCTTLLNLGLVYDKMDKVPESEKAYKEALAIYEKSYGPSSAEDGKTLHGLAETYRHHNKYNEALPLFQRALKIRDTLIPNHPDTAETLYGLADTYRHQGKNLDALPLLKRALDIRKEAFGTTHPKVARSLDSLSATYSALGKYDMAVPVYKDLLSARQTERGLDDPKVAQVEEDLAYAYSKTDKAKKAEVMFKQALAIREKHTKKDPAAYSTCIKRYAEFLKTNGRKDEAAKLEAKISMPVASTKVVPAGAATTKSAPGKTAAK